jgi:molecular chaperone GrpE
MVAQQMHDVLTRHGLEGIESTGKPFDPAVHEAVAQLPSEEVPKDHVLEEYQKGYLLGGVVLRPSKVTVSAGEQASGETAQPVGDENAES